MEPKSLFFLHSHAVKEGDEELVKLSLSRLPSSSPFVHQTPQQFPSSINNLQSINFNLDSSPSNNPLSNSRKRMFSHSFEGGDEENSLGLPAGSSPLQRSPSPSSNLTRHVVGTGSTQYQSRVRRRSSSEKPKQGKSKTIAALYPWATTLRAKVYDLNHLRSQGITMIGGDVECKGCQVNYRVEYNLEEKFKEIKDFVLANMLAMHDRAPAVWLNPTLDNCETCGNSLRPVIIGKKREINWLFLLLGQTLGCCKLSELKYFCKHTKNHKTGAKDRVLYLTYLGLCKQLDPAGPYDV